MDDVLVDYDVGARQAAMGALAGLYAAEVDRRIWQSGIEDAGDMGALDADRYLEAVGEALGIRFDRAEWLATRALATRPRPKMTALAQRVGQRATLALLTNNGLVMKEHFDRLVPHLRPLFGERMHAAAEFRTKKPDPTIFARLAALHGFAPGEAMMIDDKAGHIAGARRAGLRGHHFTGIDGLAQALARLHLI
nr:HAD-IA family hydrolase [Ancylobacter crimeensis]